MNATELGQGYTLSTSWQTVEFNFTSVLDQFEPAYATSVRMHVNGGDSEVWSGKLYFESALQTGTGLELMTSGRYSKTDFWWDDGASIITPRWLYSGRTVCRACNPGQYAAGPVESCTFCDIGHVTLEVGLSVCTTCANGRYTNQWRKFCYECAFGKYVTGAASECTLCDVGRIAKVTGLAECTVCESGRYSHLNRRSCIDCAKGKSASGPASECQGDPLIHSPAHGSLL
jgi:hypothetical protein